MKETAWVEWIKHVFLQAFLFCCTVSVFADGNNEPVLGATQKDRIQVKRELKVIGNYPEERWLGHTVTPLSDGRIFVYGNYESSVSIDSVNLDPKFRSTDVNALNPVMWDPNLHAWRKIDKAPECEYFAYLHTATALNDGRVLIAGGLCDIPRIPRAYKAMSIWNDNEGRWEEAPQLFEARIYHTATLLKDNSVLIAGGESDTRKIPEEEPVLNSVELYRDGKEIRLPAMVIARAKHTATRLMDGRVVVVGGIGSDGKALTAVEIFNPETQSWSSGPSLATARYAHTASLLSNGQLMIIGGIDESGHGTNSVEVFDPKAMTIDESVPLPLPFRRMTSIALDNNDVLFVGTGFEYDSSGSASDAGPGLSYSYLLLWSNTKQQWEYTGHLFPTRLKDILSYQLIHSPVNKKNILVFDNKNIMQWTRKDSGESITPVLSKREDAANILLSDGRIMLIGGHQGAHALDDVEIFDPKTKLFSKTGSLVTAKLLPQAILLDNGNVVVTGIRWANNALEGEAEEWDHQTGEWKQIEEINNAVDDEGLDWNNVLASGKLNNGYLVFMFMDTFNLGKETGSEKPDWDQIYKHSKYKALLWNPASGDTSIKTLNVRVRQASFDMRVLPDGKIFITGGELIPPYAHYEPWQPEIWDIRSERVETTPFPPGQANEGYSSDSLVLKNGNVLSMSRSLTEYEHTGFAIWNVQDKYWRSLPDIPDNTWRNRAREVMELNDGTLMTESYRLLPGATTWVPIQRYPQEKAIQIQLSSGQLLALSFTPPYSAFYDSNAMQWRINSNYYFRRKEIPKPALLELSDGRVMVTGALDEKSASREIVTQIWNPRDDSWQLGGKLSGDYTQSMQSFLLPSGQVLHLGLVRDGNLKCEIGHPADNNWMDCGPSTPRIKSPTSQILPEKQFVADYLHDGSIVLLMSAREGYRYDEKSGVWTSYSGDTKPFLKQFGMGEHAHALPGGCSISVPPFRIRNQNTGKDIIDIGMVTGIQDSKASMITLKNGTVVVAGYPEGAYDAGYGFFYRKAGCDGFEVYASDVELMPGIFSRAGKKSLAGTLQTAKGFTHDLTNMLLRYKWIVVALLVPFVLYKLLRKAMQRQKESGGTIELSPQIASVIRTLVYGSILSAIIYMIWPKQNQMDQEDVVISAASGRVPCFYVGVWVSTRESGGITKITLADDGRFTTDLIVNKVYSGTWSVKDDEMTWIYDDKTVTNGKPDINPISHVGKDSFVLTEVDGAKTRFKRLESIQSTTCTPE